MCTGLHCDDVAGAPLPRHVHLPEFPLAKAPPNFKVIERPPPALLPAASLRAARLVLESINASMPRTKMARGTVVQRELQSSRLYIRPGREAEESAVSTFSSDCVNHIFGAVLNVANGSTNSGLECRSTMFFSVTQHISWRAW